MLNDSPFTPGRGGLPALTLKTAAGASMDIYRHGAHLTSWKTATGKEWMFLSEHAVFAENRSIRGGVPVIFPQFSGFGSGRRHGFARTQEWRLAHSESTDVQAQCRFELTANETTLVDWPHYFHAEFTANLQNDRLTMTLSVRNTDTKPFTFSGALHSYFAVSQIRTVRLHGLKGRQFWDNNGSNFHRDRLVDDQAALEFPDAIDRVYFACQSPLQLVDGEDRLSIQAQGFSEVVVWNPGAEAAKKLADLADEEYQKMLCIEAALIDKPVTLSPGEVWSGSQVLQQESP